MAKKQQKDPEVKTDRAAKQKSIAKKYPEVWKAIGDLFEAMNDVEPEDARNVSGLIRTQAADKTKVLLRKMSAEKRSRRTERLNARIAKNAAERTKLESLREELGL